MADPARCRDQWSGGPPAPLATARGRLGPLVVRLLKLGMSVVFDFAGNTPIDRSWVRSVFENAGADQMLYHIVASDEGCKARVRPGATMPSRRASVSGLSARSGSTKSPAILSRHQIGRISSWSAMKRMLQLEQGLQSAQRELGSIWRRARGGNRRQRDVGTGTWGRLAGAGLLEGMTGE